MDSNGTLHHEPEEKAKLFISTIESLFTIPTYSGKFDKIVLKSMLLTHHKFYSLLAKYRMLSKSLKSQISWSLWNNKLCTHILRQEIKYQNLQHIQVARTENFLHKWKHATLIMLPKSEKTGI